MESEKIELGKAISLNSNYNFVITYTYPGPLSCLSGIQKGCSSVVDAGQDLGLGRFCDYMVLCAGITVTILYNRFEIVG